MYLEGEGGQVELLYNGVLVSAEQQRELAICIHISPPLMDLPPSAHPTPLGHRRAPS